ncbi:MAG: hypothetical protein ACSHX8_13605 [Opitutaceae bacterium]
MNYSVKPISLILFIPALALFSGCQTTDSSSEASKSSAPAPSVATSAKETVWVAADSAPKAEAMATKPAPKVEPVATKPAPKPAAAVKIADVKLSNKAQKRLDAYLQVSDLTDDQSQAVTAAVYSWYAGLEELRADSSLSADDLKAAARAHFRANHKEIMNEILTKTQRQEYTALKE